MFCRKRFSIQSIETCLSIKTVLISIKKSFQLCHIKSHLGKIFCFWVMPSNKISKELIPIILGNLFYMSHRIFSSIVITFAFYTLIILLLKYAICILDIGIWYLLLLLPAHNNCTHNILFAWTLKMQFVQNPLMQIGFAGP